MAYRQILPWSEVFLRAMHDAQSRQSGGEDNDGLFLRLFVRHEQALRAYARVIVPTWDAVDEVIQEASVVMWRKLDQLDSHENFLPWAKVIVRFEALRARRNVARDRLVFSEELLSMLAEEAAATEDEDLERDKVALMRCLKKLTSAYQELLLAPYTGSGRVKELAEQSGRSINSLYKLLGRLRAKLQECIEHEISAAACQKGRGSLRTTPTR
jgi:RNA polymerase sigma-70 factor (ECF subfamily)